MSTEDRLAWLRTPLGQLEFVKLLRSITSEEQRTLLLRWASRREPHLTQAEFDQVEELAGTVRAFVEQWEPADVPPMERSIAEQLELRLE